MKEEESSSTSIFNNFQHVSDVANDDYSSPVNNDDTRKSLLLAPMLMIEEDNSNNNSPPGVAEDDFYSRDLLLEQQQDHNIVRVFSIDYDGLVDRLKRAKWFAAAASVLAAVGTAVWHHNKMMQLNNDDGDYDGDYDDDDTTFAVALTAMLAAVFVGMWCTEGKNEQRIRGQHVAVTRRGIRRDAVDEHGVHTTTTIPWQQIRHLERRSHGVVSIVMVNRASRPVEIEGLRDVEGFIEMVHCLQEQDELSAAPIIL